MRSQWCCRPEKEGRWCCVPVRLVAARLLKASRRVELATLPCSELFHLIIQSLLASRV